ncbi:SH3 domain-containing protein [Stappia sp. ES.058]|uniref:SH3 domain-containing protein n=1 Tax=Stappia sp. ES.058 TaxID=1881061 RepID=UPI00087987CF|nr:SH3 domain-containing protein [Stappia sp. ES.058]SDU11125.1 SH3 domain-containing protein [Stappia sp. ES.058]
MTRLALFKHGVLLAGMVVLGANAATAQSGGQGQPQSQRLEPLQPLQPQRQPQFQGQPRQQQQAPSNNGRAAQGAQSRVQLRVINPFSQPVDFYVVDPQSNQPELVGQIAAQGTRDINSQPGLSWIFGINRQPVMTYQTQNFRFQEVTVARDGRQRPPRVADNFQPPANQGSGNRGAPQGQGQGQGLAGQRPSSPPPPGYGQQQSGYPQQQQQPGFPRQPTTGGQGQNPGSVPPPPGFSTDGNPYSQTRPTGDLTPPPGLASSTLTLSTCARARLGPAGADICRYLSRLSRENPLAYEFYLAQVKARQETRSNASQTAGQPQTPANGGALPEAASWGGIVRSGPSMQAGRVDSLSEGETITLLENTGVEMNGYDWFRIRYRGDRTGYQWGGIICGRFEEIRGAFQVCR